MLSVMIYCPNAGRQIYTGIETDESSFSKLPDVRARTRCPICGEDHVWTKRMAWLAESDMLHRRGAADHQDRRPTPLRAAADL